MMEIPSACSCSELNEGQQIGEERRLNDGFLQRERLTLREMIPIPSDGLGSLFQCRLASERTARAR